MKSKYDNIKIDSIHLADKKEVFLNPLQEMSIENDTQLDKDIFEKILDKNTMNYDENIQNIRQLRHKLENIQHLIKKDLDNDINNKDVISVFDMDGAQFQTRFKNTIYTINPIRTRLKWQTSEKPVFKCEARHYNCNTVSFKNKRYTTRRAKISVISSSTNSGYTTYEHPEDEWPIKGMLYITNIQILFRINKKNIIPIHYDQVSNFSIYNNAINILYNDRKNKKEDVFIIDPEHARLIEMFLNVFI